GTSGCEEYVTVCNMVNVWIPVPCGCGDLPGEGCKGSTCGPPLYPSYNLETQEKCEQICAYEGYNDQTGGTTSGSGTTGGAGSSSGTGTTTGPTDVVTTPVNSDGSSVAPQMLISQLNITDQNLINWINDPVNAKEVDATFIFCAENNWISEVIIFAEQAVKAIKDGGEVDFDDRIINELIGDAKCIFKKLKALNLYKGTIKQFENSDYDLIITYGDFNGEAYTDDEFIDLGIIEIKVPGLNNTYLGFAGTLLHEGIHAELFKYVHERNKGVDVNDRPNLMYHYFQLKGEVDPRFLDTTVQHEHMADKYVKPIAEAIRELDNNRYPLDYYWGFAWEGLKKYGFNKYFDSNSGNLINLDDTGFNQKQALVNSTSPFNTQTFDKNCN
ncbi:hypothetical protein VBY74_14410, partial [Tenacibaculum ascidiaceicola]|uniref:hypothetical protein n=1 Tax=Tenacibaculum ascidiaceicola TaxID=1699411 RepID=UPI0039ED8AB3